MDSATGSMTGTDFFFWGAIFSIKWYLLLPPDFGFVGHVLITFWLFCSSVFVSSVSSTAYVWCMANLHHAPVHWISVSPFNRQASWSCRYLQKTQYCSCTIRQAALSLHRVTHGTSRLAALPAPSTFQDLQWPLSGQCLLSTFMRFALSLAIKKLVPL